MGPFKIIVIDIVLGFFVSLKPGIDIRHPFLWSWMGGQISRNLVWIEPAFVSHFFQCRYQPFAVISSFSQHVESDLIRLSFVFTAVCKCIRLAGCHRTKGDCIGSFWGSGGSKKHAGNNPGKCGVVYFFSPFYFLRNMTTLYMWNFMGQYRCQLFLTIHCFQQSAVYKNVTCRSGKSIVGIFFYYIKMVEKRLRRKRRDDFLADFVDVIGDKRVCNNFVVR